MTANCKRLLLRIAIAVGGLLAGWLVAEIVLGFFEREPLRTTRVLMRLDPPAEMYYCYSSNPNGEFEALPDVAQGNWSYSDFSFETVRIPLDRIHETPYGVKTERSGQGLRDREYSPVPPPGVTRVACIGDSFVYGQGVPVDRTLPREMERLLGPGCEVVNAGRVNVDLHQEADFLPDVVNGLGCSRAIVVFMPNDIRMNAKLTFAQEYINDLVNIRDRYVAKRRREAWYSGHSRLLGAIGAAIDDARIKRETVQWYRDMYDPAINNMNINMLAEDLRRLAASPNCRVAFVIFPLLVDLEQIYPFQAAHDRVAEMARAAGLPVLDLAPAFKGIKTTSLHVHPSDHHPNGKAHAIAARAIVEWLRSDVEGFLAR